MIERRSRQGEVDPDEREEQAAKLMDVQPEGAACRTFTGTRTTAERHSAAFPNAATLLLNLLLGGRGGRGLWPPF
jgi:hypothetical protein